MFNKRVHLLVKKILMLQQSLFIESIKLNVL